MKIIDFETIKEFAANFDPNDWYNWVDYALKNKSDFEMPPKSRITQENDNYYNVMPVLYDKENLAIVKMIGRHNLKKEENRSSMMGDIMLYEADTGILKGIMDAEYITTLRTGVVAAHSVELFSKKDSKILGLIGLGNIMTVFLKTLVAKLDKEKNYTVKLYKHHNQEKRFANKFSYLKNVKFVFCDTYEDVISNSDVVISAVTKATENFASNECFKKGVTVVPISTMGFQNCDVFFDKVFTDEIEQIKGFKYFNEFKSVTNITDVLNNKAEGRTNNDQRILVYNYGIAIHDLYFAMKFFDLLNGKNIEYNYPKEKYFM
ncbi:hypothetical protein [Lactobacillus agrestimuris]|uniref:hypothetical protein n=1 Tax=Lactobacillus agrestimuris TaxID=2941328 RepID=UPI0020440416|nr:hypothetical protein [Lactobacillus agrestimuris]